MPYAPSAAYPVGTLRAQLAARPPETPAPPPLLNAAVRRAAAPEAMRPSPTPPAKTCRASPPQTPPHPSPHPTSAPADHDLPSRPPQPT
ncbi:hypothetical protein NKH77_00375 [Streptomyces sp. M19]